MTHDEQKPEFIKCPYDTRCGNYLSNPSIARESELLAVIRAMDAKLADAIDLIEREVSSSASQITLPSKDWVGLDGKLVKQYPYQTYDIEAMREARRLAEQVV